MAAQGGSCKKGSKGLEWNSNYDKFIIKWWLERNEIDMSNLMSWGELRQEFSQYSVSMFVHFSLNSYVMMSLMHFAKLLKLFTTDAIDKHRHSTKPVRKLYRSYVKCVV